jgi:hypothetical protein
MQVGTGRGFSENLATNLRSPARQGFGAFDSNAARTKKKMRAYPSYLERFVQQATSIKDWPV